MSLLVARNHASIFQNQYGYQSLLPQPIPLPENTLYDLASLTKPLITGFLLLYLVERKLISLETEVKSIFPHLTHYQGMTVQHLLTHTSGLPAWYPLYLFGDDYLKHFAYIPLNSRPGKRLLYSCPGYILLYYIIQQTSGTSYTQLAQEVIFEPLGLQNTFLNVPANLRFRAAPTELGNKHERQKAETWAKSSAGQFFLPLYLWFPWREYLIQGETHDLYSFFLGGTAGNTGLFSTTHDLFKLSREFFPDSATILSAETLSWCWKNLTPHKLTHRSIGFKCNSSFFTSGGRAFSPHAIGHNGFTGPSIWMDNHLQTHQNTTIILLTNAIHPEVKKTSLDRIRKKLFRLLIKEL